MLPLTILLINSTLALQFIVRYQALVTEHIADFQKSEDETLLNRTEEISQNIGSQFKTMIILTTVISIIICTIVGFLLSRQLAGSPHNLSNTYLQRELRFAREKIDSLINILEKQENNKE
jgi:hypothetical protein